MRQSNSAARKAAERKGGSGAANATSRGELPPYVRLALATLALAAQDAARDDEVGIRARSWLSGIVAGEPGWWCHMPGFDPARFALDVLRLTRRTYSQPSQHAPWPALPARFEQCSLFC